MKTIRGDRKRSEERGKKRPENSEKRRREGV